jgi:murein DD-endopeptidase MepM/ murein hydrolase activator NlpD
LVLASLLAPIATGLALILPAHVQVAVGAKANLVNHAGNTLFQLHRGLDDCIYISSTTDGQSWTAWTKVTDNARTGSAPAAASFGGKIYVIYRGTDDKLYITSSFNGVNGWSFNGQAGWSRLSSDALTKSAPAVIPFNGRLFVVHRGFDNHIYITSSYDGINWNNGWSKVLGDDTITPSAPAIGYFNGRLYIVHRGFDNRIYFTSSSDGFSWDGWKALPGSSTFTASAPAIAFVPTAFGQTLYITYRGTDNLSYVSTSANGSSWTNPIVVSKNRVTRAAPAIMGFKEKLYLTRQDFSNNLFVSNSFSLSSWSTDIQIGGALTPPDNDDTITSITPLSSSYMKNISQDFGGWNSYFGGYHTGFDIATRNENPSVYAVDDGEVVWNATELSKYKTQHDKYWNAFVIIKHNGYYAYYGHLASPFLSIGNKVTKGSLIGQVRDAYTNQDKKDTNNNHLHISISIGKDWVRSGWGYQPTQTGLNQFVNPRKYIGL